MSSTGLAIQPVDHEMIVLSIPFPHLTVNSRYEQIICAQALKNANINISMDGRGRYLDNIFIERVWRSLKYEEVFLHAYQDLTEARLGIGRYFHFYNDTRPHQALGYQTPDAFYRMEPARAA